MALFPLCEDPLIKTLRRLFNANIVLVPDERVQPLSMVAKIGRKNFFRGELAPLLTSPGALSKGPQVKKANMANIAGKQSREVTLDVGLEILDGFLRGFGIPSAQVRAKFKGASKVSFSFNKVERRYVDVNELGQRLRGQVIDKENPAAEIFFNEESAKLLLIDGVITSQDFSINVEESSQKNFKLDVPAIDAIVGSLKPELKVASQSGLDLTFQGDKALTFAFTCLKINILKNGKIKGMPPARRVPALGIGTQKKSSKAYDGITPFADTDLGRVLLYRRPGLILWDE